MAIYTQSGSAAPVEAEVPVYGSNRLGTYFTTGGLYRYEIRDNVGSVRVVLMSTKNSSTNQANVFNYSDYYPFGSIAQSAGTSYRYDYQGAYAEKDPVTGFNNFELRMYDGRIGRWLSTDPKGQFASPYEGMGNNPVTGIDKNGGEDGNSDSPPDIIITGSDNKTLTIKAPGPDININVDQKIGKDQTIDLGIQNLNNVAIGYSSSLTGQLQLLWGASGFAEVDHVLFFDKTYGGYWYDYLGGGGSVRLGAGGGVSGNVGANLFVAYNTSGRPADPSTWAGATYFAGYDIDVKDIVGAGVNAQFFGNSTWKGISIGGSLGAGSSANIGTGFVGASYSKQLTPSVPTSNRSYWDIGSNWYNNTIAGFMGLPKF
jgi:RHS repeat-associated protein